MDGQTHRMAQANMGPDEQSASRMTEEAPAAESGWKLESLTVRPAENGGVIVTCNKRRERTSEKSTYEDTFKSKDFAFTAVEDALGLIREQLGGAEGSVGAGGHASTPQAARY